MAQKNLNHHIFLRSYKITDNLCTLIQKHACSSRPSFSPPPTFPSTLNNTNGLLLDKETLSIVQQTLVKTLLDLGKLKFHCPGIDGTFPDLLDCTKYYTCVGSTHTVQECDVGEGYEALAKGCVRNESVPLCQKVQKLPGNGSFILQNKIILILPTLTYLTWFRLFLQRGERSAHFRRAV